jgi:hypothetical protein
MVLVLVFGSKRHKPCDSGQVRPRQSTSFEEHRLKVRLTVMVWVEVKVRVRVRVGLGLGLGLGIGLLG